MRYIDGLSLCHNGQYITAFSCLSHVTRQFSSIWLPPAPSSTSQVNGIIWINRHRPLIWLRLAECCIHHYRAHNDKSIWHHSNDDKDNDNGSADMTTVMSSSYALKCLQMALSSLHYVYDDGKDTSMSADDRQYYQGIQQGIWLNQSYVALTHSPSDAELALTAANSVLSSSASPSHKLCAQSYAADALCQQGKFEQVTAAHASSYYFLYITNNLWLYGSCAM
jgi:hypothetical protein